MEDATVTVHDLDELAEQLITELNRLGVPADRYITGPGSEGVNVWAPDRAVVNADPNINRYPQASVLFSGSGQFHEISWGPRWEHTVPLSTPLVELAAAVFDTLPVAVREAAGADR